VRFAPEDIQKFNEYTDEYDIFLSNGKSVAIVSIKYNVKRGDINQCH